MQWQLYGKKKPLHLSRISTKLHPNVHKNNANKVIFPPKKNYRAKTPKQLQMYLNYSVFGKYEILLLISALKCGNVLPQQIINLTFLIFVCLLSSIFAPLSTHLFLLSSLLFRSVLFCLWHYSPSSSSHHQQRQIRTN